MGLSPRMRGNHHLGQLLVAVNGSIPAYAGEPADEILAVSDMRVYPRVCGGTC